MSKTEHPMRKHQLLLASTVTTLLFMTGAVGLLSDRLVDQKQYIDQQRQVLQQLNAELQGERQLNRELQVEIQRLEDSIALLEHQKADLARQLRHSQVQVNQLRQELQLMRAKIAALNAELEELSQARERYQARIEQLEIEKLQLLDSLQLLQQQTTQAEKVVDDQHKAQNEKEAETARLERIRQVVLRTAVQWREVQLSRKPDGSGPLYKVRPGTDEWRYTKVVCALGHPQPKLLFGQKFVLQIVDTDTGKPLPYLEVNPSFPDSPNNTIGVHFVFSNNPVTLTYRNDMVKEGQNYELQLFLEDNGQLYRLVHGVRPLIKDGKVIRH